MAVIELISSAESKLVIIDLRDSIEFMFVCRESGMQCYSIKRWLGLVCLWATACHMEVLKVCWCQLNFNTLKEIYSCLLSKVP